MRFILHRILACMQLHRFLEEGEYSRHNGTQEILLKLLGVPIVDYKRRRSITHLYGDTYIACYYLTNSRRYLRFVRGAHLGSSMIRPTVTMGFSDLTGAGRGCVFFTLADVASSFHNQFEDALFTIERVACVDCTMLLTNGNLRISLTEDYLKIIDGDATYVSIKLDE